MVRTVDNENKADAVTSQTFLSSINTWYNEKGIHCSVNLVSDFFKSNFNNKKEPNIAVKLNILEDMPKCRARALDNEGKVIKVEDEISGESKPKIELIKNPEEVTFFFKLKEVGKHGDETEGEEAFISKNSSAYPLINLAFTSNGDLDESNDKSIIANNEELKNALEGFEFIAKCAKGDFKGKKYNYLLAEPVGQQEILPEKVEEHETKKDDRELEEFKLTPSQLDELAMFKPVQKALSILEIKEIPVPTNKELIDEITMLKNVDDAVKVKTINKIKNL